MKKQSFMFGAILLSISGIICKILGAVYKIPLSNILGSEGVGLYYLVFPTYAFLLSLSSTSFATVISKKISIFVSKNKLKESHDFFVSSLIFLSFCGLVATLFLISCSKIISHFQGVENSFFCYIIIAPAILSVSIQSAFKGYFQGLQNMSPTAFSQIIAQIIKLSLGFTFAKMFIENGVVFGAFGALLGITVSELITCLFFVVYYFIFKHKNKKLFEFKRVSQKNIFKYVKMLIKESIPFTLSSVILPLSLMVDSFLIINILNSMNFGSKFSTSLLGLNTGVVNTLISLPSTISVSICVVIVPYITFALNKKDFKSVYEKTSLALKFTFYIAIPCIIIFALFSNNILNILYKETFSGNNELKLASNLLLLSSINVLYLSLLQITTSLLQAINKSYIPVVSLGIGLIIKVVVEAILINNPYINIFGSALANALCYCIATCINIYYFRKEIKLNFTLYKTVFCPIISSFLMGAIIFICLKIFENFLPSLVATLISFGIGGVFYVLFIFLFKGFSLNEFKTYFNLKKSKTT